MHRVKEESEKANSNVQMAVSQTAQIASSDRSVGDFTFQEENRYDQLPLSNR
jgi:hypothetical protein